MGLSPSKRVDATLRRSPAFAAACDVAFDRCRADAQGAFGGVRRYQLAAAAAHLHAALRASVPLVRRWVPSQPPRARVDAAGLQDEEELNRPQFWEFAAELFREAVLAGAAEAAFGRAPAAAAGIVGMGVVARAAPLVIGRVVAIYAAGVAATVYLGLG
ncbi:unnamed protein product [Urochloa humidicola]